MPHATDEPSALPGFDPDAATRLTAAEGGKALLRGPLGRVIAQPWLDRTTLLLLRRYFFPLSRLWAAARSAHGSVERFYDEMPMLRWSADERRLAATLAQFEEARAAVSGVEVHWHDVFFGQTAASEPERVALETARLNRRHAYNAVRLRFSFLLRPGLPRVRQETAGPEEVDRVFGNVLDGHVPLAPVPVQSPELEVSKPVPGKIGIDQWLRFKSPSPRLGDQVYARMHTPEGVSNPPTVVFGHGVCVEFDHWRGLIDEVDALVAAGVRVIRPEAPWHGRRVPPGSFGGEHVIGAFPLGALDTFQGALMEWAVLARWARATSTGPLGFAGSSLGALTAQLAAAAFRDQNAAVAPDALFLVTHCGSIADAVLHGELSRMWDTRDGIVGRGWTEPLIRRLFLPLEPGSAAPVAPERIVSVLGSRDTVTPFASGRNLVASWGVPTENRFVWHRGHFTVPMTLLRDPTPTHRFIDILRSL